jgi:hypothetical protein
MIRQFYLQWTCSKCREVHNRLIRPNSEDMLYILTDDSRRDMATIELLEPINLTCTEYLMERKPAVTR